MALPNDSLLVTPGSGATAASHLAGSKEYEVWLQAESRKGHLWGAAPHYVARYPTARVHDTAEAGANTWELFNASGSGVIIALVRWMWGPSPNTSGMPQPLQYELRRVTAAATVDTGTVLALNPLDTTNPSVPSQVTLREYDGDNAMTGGTAATALYTTDMAGSNVATGDFNNCRMLQGHPFMDWRGRMTPIICNEGEGVRAHLITGNDNISLFCHFAVAIL